MNKYILADMVTERLESGIGMGANPLPLHLIAMKCLILYGSLTRSI
ncbi:MAG: hypothetical protein ACXABY_32425 [Candidatus Thorarchaeota archaeon]